MEYKNYSQFDFLYVVHDLNSHNTRRELNIPTLTTPFSHGGSVLNFCDNPNPNPNPKSAYYGLWRLSKIFFLFLLQVWYRYLFETNDTYLNTTDSRSIDISLFRWEISLTVT